MGLKDYDYQIVYKNVKPNTNADGLSQIKTYFQI